MQGIRFYEEFKNTSKTRGAGTVVAALVCNGLYYSNGKACYGALSGVYDRPDSPVASGGVSLEYLAQKCKHISESRAREIHPELFKRLDEED